MEEDVGRRRARRARDSRARVAIATTIIIIGIATAGTAQAGDPPDKESKELRWGNDSQGGAPYVFQDPMDPNHLVGFEVDLASALAAKLDMRARPIQGQWENLIELLNRGDFDVALNGIEYAEEKRRVCALTNPYYVAPERLTVRKGDPNAPRTIEALKGRKIGTLPGSLASRILDRAGAEVKTYEGGQNQIYDDLMKGRTDGVLLDGPITRYFGEIESERLEVVPGSFGEVSYVMAVRQKDGELLDRLNAAIAELGKDGTLRKVYDRWGLWNDETARLFSDPRPASSVAQEYEKWKVAVGKIPPFLERVRTRYPATIPIFARAAVLTLSVSIISMIFAIWLGRRLAIMRTYPPLLGNVERWIALAYVEVVRGTPLLVQLTLIYYGLPELGINLDPFIAGALALGLNYAASEAENFRAAIEAIPAGQLEASWALGLSTRQAFRLVIWPQARRMAIPTMTNDFIALLKDSSLISVVTLTELTKTYSSLANSMRDFLGLGVVVALWYLAIGLPFARLARYAETRLGQHLRRTTP
jgi:polar amino acid transport system substrate-binding protein